MIKPIMLAGLAALMATQASAWGFTHCNAARTFVNPHVYFKHCNDFIGKNERIGYFTSRWWNMKYSDVWAVDSETNEIVKSPTRIAREEAEANSNTHTVDTTNETVTAS